MYSVLKFGGSSVATATNISRVLDIVGAEVQQGRQVILVSSAISGCTDALLEIAAAGTPSARKIELCQTLLERHLAIARRLFTGREQEAMAPLLQGLFEEMMAAPDAAKVTFGEIFSTRILAEKLRCEHYRTQWLDSRELVVSDDLPESYRRIAAAVGDDAQIFVAPGFIARDSAGTVTTLGRGGSDYSAAIYAAAVGAVSLQIWTDVPGIMTANPKAVSHARTVPQMPYQAALDMARCGAKVLYAPTVAPAMEAGIAIEIKNTFDPANPGTTIQGAPSQESYRWIGVTSLAENDHIRMTLVASGVVPAKEKETILQRLAEALRRGGIQALGEAQESGGLFSFPVSPMLEKQALEVLHREFFETVPLRTVDVYIAGRGAVGTTLVEIIAEASDTIRERTGKILRIADVADSRRPAFVDEILAAHPRGAVFVDCTNSHDLYRRYADLLRAGISIVSSNRRSFAVPYVEYAAMHAAAMQSGTFLRYETTVGAALPVLDAIAESANSCDEILSVEAVVSCTLNQILGDYTGEDVSFAALLRQAQEAGLTERDPRVDLGGRDALRKLLILSRVAGIPLEESDVEVEPVVKLSEGTTEEFYADLEAQEPVLSLRALKASVKGRRLRFVASLEKDPAAPKGYRASIRVREVEKEHPAYHLRGTENAIILRSAFHPYPLVIEGAGEGAKQAASSILNDILK
ncbi:MAG: aspartate kinase [Bacteroidales bacterium]|nr:aspartate kinase [Bacteroidales bacterium]